jgi:rhomboid protease GluP
VFGRKREGSVICAYCGVLVGVNDERCYSCNRRNPGLWGFAPVLRSFGQDLGFVPFAIGTCVILFGLTLVASRGQIGLGGAMSFLSPSTTALFLFGASGAAPVFGLGRWWTVLSAAWLHAGALHIFFNMWVLRQMGPAAADLYGPARTVIIYTIGAIAGFALSSIAGQYFPAFFFLRGSTFTVGASAPIAGLIGAIFHYGRSGSSVARQYAMQYIIAMIFYALFLPGIDNYAHAGGFAGGYLAAAYLNPHHPERVQHVVIALLCLAASILAILASVLDGLQYF